ncbi:MAG: hypothetical protein MR024_03845 [Firmicutes bacterium]|nr:hypothetical protein [Bacillota bacterium]
MEINENSKKELLENLNTHIETEEKVRDALVSAGLVFTSIGAGILVTTFQVPVLGPIAGTAISTASLAFAAGSFVAAIKSQVKFKRLKNVKKWLEENDYSKIMKNYSKSKDKVIVSTRNKVMASMYDAFVEEGKLPARKKSNPQLQPEM